MTTNTARAAAGDARSISQSIAEHVVAFDYSQLPASAVQAAKTLILDTLAVGWAGTTAPGAPEAHALLTEEGGRGDSSVWGYGGKLPVASAAFLNSISGPFAAAATAAKLLKLDATATRHALGIALSQAAGTQQSNIEQALTKRLQGALSARSGVFSAQLAQRGITAPREAIEGKFGLFALYQEGNPLKILDGLGSR